MKRRGFFWMGLLLLLTLAKPASGQSLKDFYQQGSEKFRISDFRGALEAWEKGLAIANSMDNKQAITTFLTTIGIVYQQLSDYPKALSYHEQSLKIIREIEDEKGEGNSLGNIANVYPSVA